MDSDAALVIFLAAITGFSALWGLATRISAPSKRVTSLAAYFMRYSRSPLDPIRAYIIWFIYLFVGLIGCVIPLVVFQINIFRYLPMELRDLVFIPLGLIAQMSLSSLILMLIAAFNPKLDWFSALMNIQWVKILMLLPRTVSLLYPLSGAFFEELFYRGVVFLVLVDHFSQLGVVLPIVISAVLFSIQQVLNTSSVPQALTMAAGSVAISVIGCLLMLHTQSFLPALICHEVYAVLYLMLGKPAASYKAKAPGGASAVRGVARQSF